MRAKASASKKEIVTTSFRISKSDKKYLEEKAALAGVSVSDELRSLIHDSSKVELLLLEHIQAIERQLRIYQFAFIDATQCMRCEWCSFRDMCHDKGSQDHKVCREVIYAFELLRERCRSESDTSNQKKTNKG